MVAYDFDNFSYARDASPNNYLLMPSEMGMIDFSEGSIPGMERAANRLIVSFWEWRLSRGCEYSAWCK